MYGLWQFLKNSLFSIFSFNGKFRVMNSWKFVDFMLSSFSSNFIKIRINALEIMDVNMVILMCLYNTRFSKCYIKIGRSEVKE